MGKGQGCFFFLRCGVSLGVAQIICILHPLEVLGCSLERWMKAASCICISSCIAYTSRRLLFKRQQVVQQKRQCTFKCLSGYLDGDFSVPFPLSREAILVVMVFFIMISWNTFPCRTLSTASLSNGLVSGMLNNTLGWGGGGV